MQRAIFLDRDGVLIKDGYDLCKYAYATKVSEVRMMDDVFMVLLKLKAKGYLLVVLSNQSGVTREGEETVEDVLAVEREIQRRVGGLIDRFYYCFHGRMEGCSCRKPEKGLLLQAQKEFDIQFLGSYMVGDWDSDIELCNDTPVKPYKFLGGSFKQVLEYILENESRSETH